MLLEYEGANDLTALVRNGRDDEATQVIAGVIPDGLTPLLQRFQPLFQSPTFVRAAAVARDLLADQGPPHVLHGDLHHENVICHPERGWPAIDPKGFIGDRTYDAANGLCNPSSLPEIVRDRKRLLRQTRIMAEALDIDRERLLAYVYAEACLLAIWCLEVGVDPSHWLAMAEISADGRLR